MQSAAATGDIAKVQAFLDNGISPDADGIHQRSVLANALLYGQMETARLLLARGANPDTAMQTAAYSGHAERVSLLLQYGATVRGAKGASALGWGLRSEDIPTVKLLLAQPGIPIDAWDEYGESAIHRAAESGDWTLFQTVIAYGANCTLRDAYGRTPLMRAVGDGPNQTRICRYLIAHGNNVNEVDGDGKTALIELACLHQGDSTNSEIETLNLLLANHAVIQAQDNQGYTALRYATEQGNGKLKACLRNAGAIL